MSQEYYKNKYLRYKSKYLDLKYGGDDIYLKKQRIANFIRVLFASIGRGLPPSLCFFEGSLVIQDNDNSLYNLLRYGVDKNEEDEDVEYTDLNQRHMTSDYMEVFKRNSRVKMEFYNNKNEHEQVLCDKGKCLKFELVFNKPLENLCEKHLVKSELINNKYHYYDVIEDMYKQPKESILFYKFVYNNNKYIFLKLLPKNYEQMKQMEQMEGGNRKRRDQLAKKNRELEELKEQLKKQEQEQEQEEPEELKELKKQLEKERQERQEREEEIKDKLERVKKLDEENERKQRIKEQDEQRNQGRTYLKEEKIRKEKEAADQIEMSKFYIRDETNFPDYIENPENNLKTRDNWFYRHLYANANGKEEMNKINYYNDHLRTGKELFIPEQLKNEIIQFSKSEAETKKYVSFYNFKNIKDIVEGSELTSTLAYNINTDDYPISKEGEKKRLENKRWFF